MRSLFVFLFTLVALCLIAKGDQNGSPAWAAEAVFYQIFPERFCNGDPKNDPTRESLEFPVTPGPSWRISSWTADWYSRDEWEKQLGPDFYKNGVFDRRYGGDLEGVLNKLDYLNDLGINAIYFNPLFYSRSLHKYDGNSYHHIDPYFGPDPEGDFRLMAEETADPKTWQWTAADKMFLEVIKEAHKRGMHVIIDGVFNHTGRDFFAFKDIREKQERSAYKDWYQIESFDDPRTARNEFNYKGWWGHKTLPIFAASADKKDMAAGPKNYIFEATRRWMQPRGEQKNGIDGWRLDVADERPAKFWADWNGFVRTLNPDAYTTAEIWKNAAQLLKEGGFSASMNYNAFAIPVKGCLIDNNVAPSKFARMIDERRKMFPPATAAVMQNLLDSHDTDRLASMIVNGEGTRYQNPAEIEFNKDDSPASSKTYKINKPDARQRKIQRLVVLFQMCYLGAPMIYYGDEAGMWGAGDPDDRMPMIWKGLTYEPQSIDPRGRERSPDEVKFDEDLFDFYKTAIGIRRKHEALNHGDFSIVATDDSHRVLVTLRQSKGEKLYLVTNRGDADAKIDLPTSDKISPMFASSGDSSAVKVQNSGLVQSVTVPGLTGVILRSEKK
jgi:glycosidase